MAENPWTKGIEPSADHRNQSETNRLWAVMEQTLAQSTIEQRRARRWGIFFKTITLGYVIGISLFVVNRQIFLWMRSVLHRTPQWYRLMA